VVVASLVLFALLAGMYGTTQAIRGQSPWADCSRGSVGPGKGTRGRSRAKIRRRRAQRESPAPPPEADRSYLW